MHTHWGSWEASVLMPLRKLPGDYRSWAEGKMPLLIKQAFRKNMIHTSREVHGALSNTGILNVYCMFVGKSYQCSSNTNRMIRTPSPRRHCLCAILYLPLPAYIYNAFCCDPTTVTIITRGTEHAKCWQYLLCKTDHAWLNAPTW